MKIENISYEEAKKRLQNIDKKRKLYYEYINKGHIWGDKRDFDFCIDSSVLGVDGTVDLIVDLVNNIKEKGKICKE